MQVAFGDADGGAGERLKGSTDIAAEDVAEDFDAVRAVIEVEGAVLGVMVEAAALVVVEVIMPEPVAEHAGVLAGFDDPAIFRSGQAVSDLVEFH